MGIRPNQNSHTPIQDWIRNILDEKKKTNMRSKLEKRFLLLHCGGIWLHRN